MYYLLIRGTGSYLSAFNCSMNTFIINRLTENHAEQFAEIHLLPVSPLAWNHQLHPELSDFFFFFTFSSCCWNNKPITNEVSLHLEQAFSGLEWLSGKARAKRVIIIPINKAIHSRMRKCRLKLFCWVVWHSLLCSYLLPSSSPLSFLFFQRLKVQLPSTSRRGAWSVHGWVRHRWSGHRSQSSFKHFFFSTFFYAAFWVTWWHMTSLKQVLHNPVVREKKKEKKIGFEMKNEAGLWGVRSRRSSCWSGGWPRGYRCFICIYETLRGKTAE